MFMMGKRSPRATVDNSLYWSEYKKGSALPNYFRGVRKKKILSFWAALECRLMSGIGSSIGLSVQ